VKSYNTTTNMFYFIRSKAELMCSQPQDIAK